ncbi:hypothetical protein LguiB_027900 [Lonicera macranthoides]
MARGTYKAAYGVTHSAIILEALMVLLRGYGWFPNCLAHILTILICSLEATEALFCGGQLTGTETNYYSTKNPLNSLHLDDALNSFNRMLRTRPLPPIQRFNQLLSAIVKMKHYSVAISLIRRLHLLGITSSRLVKPDIYTFTVAINCFCHSNRVDFAFSILGKIFKLGLQPTCATFTTLIKGLCLDGNIARAVRFFDEIVERGFQPNLITYGTIINGLCKIGNTRAAILLLNDMEQMGSCQPGIVQYSTIIDSLCKDKQVDEALKMFSNMAEKGITPDVVTYTSLIHGLCNLGQWKEATKLLSEMTARNISLNVQIYSVLVDTLCKEGMVKDAHKVLDLMIQIYHI